MTWGKPLPAPFALALGDGALWGIDPVEQAVMRIDPGTGRRTMTIDAGSDLVAVAYGAGAVWVALADAGAVARIDPRTKRVIATIPVGHRPQGVVVAGGLVWVAVRA